MGRGGTVPRPQREQQVSEEGEEKETDGQTDRQRDEHEAEV